MLQKPGTSSGSYDPVGSKASHFIQLVYRYSTLLKYNMLELKCKNANYYKNNNTTKIKIKTSLFDSPLW